MGEDFHQSEQRRQPHFVVFTADAAFQLREGVPGCGQPFPVGFDYGARHRHFDSQELITFSVLAGAGLEESAQTGDLGRVCGRQHGIV